MGGPTAPAKGLTLLTQKVEPPKMFQALLGGKGGGMAAVIQLKRQMEEQVLTNAASSMGSLECGRDKQGEYQVRVGWRSG